MKNITLFIFSVILFSYLPLLTISQNDRAFVYELFSWTTRETRPNKTCIDIIATGMQNIYIRLFISDKNGPSVITYDPSIYGVNEYLSRFISKVSIYSYNCAYGIDDEIIGNKEEIIELTGYELAEVVCVDCISHFNKVSITANMRIVVILFTAREKGITFQNSKIFFLEKTLANGSCCSVMNKLNAGDECISCMYSYLVILRDGVLKNTRLYSSEDNNQSVSPNVVRNGISQYTYTETTKVYVSILEQNINKIDEFSQLSQTKLYPNKRIYYYSIHGDYNKVIISGSLILSSEGYCGIMGWKLCNFYNENSTYDNNGELVCANSIYDDPPDCKRDHSPCATHPCQNDAKCISILFNYECICQKAWAGINCNIPVCDPDCGELPCLPGNKCGTKTSKFILKLRQSLSCNNYKKCKNGRCVIQNGVRKCVCENINSFGKYCEYTCANSCKDGQCVLLKMKPTCICDDALLGVKCGEKRITEEEIQESKKFKLAVFLGGFCVLIIITIVAAIYCYSVSKSTKYLNFLKFTRFTNVSKENDSNFIYKNENLYNKGKSKYGKSIITSNSGRQNKNQTQLLKEITSKLEKKEKNIKPNIISEYVYNEDDATYKPKEYHNKILKSESSNKELQNHKNSDSVNNNQNPYL